MTPKEKAKDLIIKHLTVSSKNNYNMSYTVAKQCALITLRDTIWVYLNQLPIDVQQYWKEVKNEIELL